MPSSLIELLPAVTRSTVILLARSNVTLLFSPPFVILRLSLAADKSTVSCTPTALAFLPPTDSVQPWSTYFCNDFNCATLTASVSPLPAATPTIWRVFFDLASPTLTAPSVLAHIMSSESEGPLVKELYPIAPAATSATDSLPRATPLCSVALASEPIAIERSV